MQDEIDLGKPAQITWTMHTQAKIDLDAGLATLTLGNVHLQAKILEPAGAKFEAASAEMDPPQNQNKDVRKLPIRLPVKAGSTRIAVLLTPYRETSPSFKPVVEPLEHWISHGVE